MVPEEVSLVPRLTLESYGRQSALLVFQQADGTPTIISTNFLRLTEGFDVEL